MAITQTITTIPDAGHRGVDARETFVTKQEAFQDALTATTVTQLNNFATQANTLETNVNAKEASAVSASNVAVGAANYKGDWVSGYLNTGYLIGMSVTYSGFQYISKINNNLATPSGVTDANWLKIVSTDDTKLPLSGGTMIGYLNTARATVASNATTADIWGALGNQINWTGTATTTTFPNAPQAGIERVLICSGACAFTASVNMLIDGVISGTTVTCAINDTIIVRAISTTQFKLTRLKADGTAQVSGGFTLASTNSQVIVNFGASPNGTVNTCINRFTTTELNTGTAITYADSATLGASFTIKETGLYEIFYTVFGIDTTFRSYGISLNSAQLTTDIKSITTGSRLGFVDCDYNRSRAFTRVIKLTAGDVLRPHAQSSSSILGASADYVKLSIKKIGA